MHKIVAGLIFLLLNTPLFAAVQSKTVEYQDDGVTLTGYLYWDDAVQGARPGVLVIHEWWGLNDYAKKRAQMLAELGYVAFAADMYGDGQVTDKPDQARTWMQEITADVEGWRARANPRSALPHLFLAIFYVEAGRGEEAQVAVAEALKRKPKASIAGYLKAKTFPYKDQADIDKVVGDSDAGGG